MTGVGGTVTGTGGTVTSVGGTVTGIGGTVASVGGTVTGVGSTVASVGGTVTGVRSTVTTVGGTVTGAGEASAVGVEWLGWRTRRCDVGGGWYVIAPTGAPRLRGGVRRAMNGGCHCLPVWASQWGVPVGRPSGPSRECPPERSTGRWENARRPVSRVLSAPSPDPKAWSERGTTIPLGRALPRASRDQPGWRDGNVPEVPGRAGDGSATPIRSCSRWGLPCRRRYRRRGALLPHRFTRARRLAPRKAP